MKNYLNSFLRNGCLLTLAAGMLACSDSQRAEACYDIIPLPQQITPAPGNPFVLKKSTPVIYAAGDTLMARNAAMLADYVNESTGYTLKTGTKDSDRAIRLIIDPSVKETEGYTLTIRENGIELAAATHAGIFYGIQSIRKALPAIAEKQEIELPAATLRDYPRFDYRGMMLDVGRHFQPVDSVKTFIDMLALHNINRLHWHLTEDQGWRIEIKKYPRLTEIGSKRKETLIGKTRDQYDGIPHAGFYTQDEIREVVAYAAERFITIIPEIDLPGHQLAALASYPELGCTGGPYEVWTHWGISNDVICAGNEQAMQFLEDVLGEVIDLFPTEYIHIGGDESPKIRWQSCPKCQARIKAEGIKGDAQHSKEEQLQSYITNRMERFVESKGRRIIGWEEIMEGGLTPNATVMSWKSTESGIKAASQNHDVIMAPMTHLYFDFYQTKDTKDEPVAIGGYNPIEKVYAFEPTEGVPAGKEHFIKGVQANLWTEYIPTFSHVQYMTLPRMAALAEVQWTMPEKKDYETFLPRLVRMMELYDRLGWNYSRHIFDLQCNFRPDTENGQILVDMATLGNAGIYYTLDGSEPDEKSISYNAPFAVNQNVTVKAVAIRPSGKSKTVTEKISFNKATTKPIRLKTQPYPIFAGDASLLNDGLSGDDNYQSGRWIGFLGNNLEAVIDLKQPEEISCISFNTNVKQGYHWNRDARGIIVKVSDDGKTFREVASEKFPPLTAASKDGIYPHIVSFHPVKTRYVEIIIEGDKLPDYHGSAGKPAILFVDEIKLN